MKEKIFLLRKEGKSIREIGKIVGLGKTTVWYYLNSKKSNISQKVGRRKLKEELIQLRGSKCEICGYNRCLQALDFHHVDNKQKNFSISNGSRLGKAKNVIIDEIKKCVLLCSNCHHEVHEGMALVGGFEPADLLSESQMC